jgi:hypothetical protein
MAKSFRLAQLLLLLVGWICTGGAAAAETKKCPGLRALNGECANPLTVADAQSRAMIISTVRVSYYGTPIGDIGGPFIPFYKQFQNSPVNINQLVYGLPTYTFLTPFNGVGCPAPGECWTVRRTK